MHPFVAKAFYRLRLSIEAMENIVILEPGYMLLPVLDLDIAGGNRQPCYPC